MSISLEQARRTKPKAKAAALTCAGVVGVGLTKIGDSYAVKVNVSEYSPAVRALPEVIDGVRIVYELTGPLTLRQVGEP